jgi:AMMECR1 domain-containing protein
MTTHPAMSSNSSSSSSNGSPGVQCTKQHCFLACHALWTHLQPQQVRPLPHPVVAWAAAELEDATVPSAHPLFVTWKVGEGEEEEEGEGLQLRGCLGTFAPQSLARGIPAFALRAGLEDPRFSPLRRKEVERFPAALQVTVSLLHSFEPVPPPASSSASESSSSPTTRARAGTAEVLAHTDWTLGTHGLQLGLVDYAGRTYSGTFLPAVAAEQGWDKGETLRHLLAKAGYAGASPIAGFRLQRYQSSTCSCTLAEYLEAQVDGTVVAEEELEDA